jgi:hypothetical protein
LAGVDRKRGLVIVGGGAFSTSSDVGVHFSSDFPQNTHDLEDRHGEWVRRERECRSVCHVPQAAGGLQHPVQHLVEP